MASCIRFNVFMWIVPKLTNGLWSVYRTKCFPHKKYSVPWPKVKQTFPGKMECSFSRNILIFRLHSWWLEIHHLVWIKQGWHVPSELHGVPLTGVHDENVRQLRLRIVDHRFRNQNRSEFSKSFIGLQWPWACLPRAVLPRQGIGSGCDLGKVPDMPSEEVAKTEKLSYFLNVIGRLGFGHSLELSSARSNSLGF